MNCLEEVSHDETGVFILDGGFATQLEAYGEDLNILWSAKLLIENPARIKQVHQDYINAGADVIISSSYQATIQGFQKIGVDEVGAIELLRKSVELAVSARDDAWETISNEQAKAPVKFPRKKPLVAASIGCYGAAQADGSEYTGGYKTMDISSLMDWHRKRFYIIAECDGVDIVAFETIPCLNEVEALQRLAIEFNQKHPNKIQVYIFVSCCDGHHLNSGEPIEDMGKILTAVPNPILAAVGINCSPPNFIEELLGRLKCPPGCLKLVYPNSGEQWNACTHEWLTSESIVKTKHAEFISNAKRWIAAGARGIGGCCRTGPDHVEALRKTYAPETC